MTIIKNNCAVQENKDLFRARDDDYRKEQLCCAIKQRLVTGKGL